MRLNTRDIQNIALFESITGARVVDCIESENSLNFLIKRGDMGMAVGKKGSTISKVNRIVGKNVHVYEDSDDLAQLVKNLFSQTDVSVNESAELVRIRIPKKNRVKITGKRMRLVREFIKRRSKKNKVEFVFS
jgi:N utilization substance protein A